MHRRPRTSGLSILSLLVVNGGWLGRGSAVVLAEIFRVKTTQLRSSAVGRELPIDLAVDPVSRFLPGMNFATEQFRTLNTTIQALTLQDAEFTFGNVQPTSVFWRVMNLQSFGQLASDLRLERFVERAR